MPVRRARRNGRAARGRAPARRPRRATALRRDAIRAILRDVPTKLAILDRDGTLVDVVRDAETGVVTTAFHPAQLRLLEGAVEGLGALARAGFTLAIATNQPGPAKGHFAADAVRRTNDALVAKLADRGVSIARVATCMHHPEGGEGGDPSLVGPCACRKPKPGLLVDLMTSLGATPASTWMIGDSTADLAAAAAAGVRSALVFAENRCELCPLRAGPSALAGPRPTVFAPRLDRIAAAILAAESA